MNGFPRASFADLAFAVGSRCIEIAQHDRADLAGRGDIGQEVLDCQFGAAVDVDRLRRFGFRDGQRLGHPIDRHALENTMCETPQRRMAATKEIAPATLLS